MVRRRASPFSHSVVVSQVTDIIQNERCLFFTESHEMALNLFFLWKLATHAFFFNRLTLGKMAFPTTLNKAAQASAFLSVSLKHKLYRSHTVMPLSYDKYKGGKMDVKEEMTKKLSSPGSSIYTLHFPYLLVKYYRYPSLPEIILTI